MSEHSLKIMRRPFLDLQSGAKTSEVRNCADRDFQVGDTVVLNLIDETGNLAGQSLRRSITHIQRGYGLPEDICVLSYDQPSDGALTNEGAEPVAYIDPAHLQTMGKTATGSASCVIFNNSQGGCLEPLYRRPPAPASADLPATCSCPSGDGSLRWPCPVHPPEVRMLVLPERKIVLIGVLSESNTHNHGWNACLDRVKELNS